MPRRYDELRIGVWGTGKGRDQYFVLATGPACASAVIDLEGARDFHGELNNLLRVAFRQEQLGEEPVGKSLQRLGDDLGRLFLPRAIRDCYMESLQQAKDRNRALRLRFDLPPSLTQIPIELLKIDAGFLALDPNVSIVRSLPVGVANPMRQFQPEKHLTIVLAGSSPESEDYDDLSLDEEIEKTIGKLRFVSQKGIVTIKQEGHATKSSLRVLSGQPQGVCAVVLDSHGGFDEAAGEGYVVLEDQNRKPDCVSSKHLPGFLASGQGVRFVALNLCKGAKGNPYDPVSSVATQLIATGVPIVVAFQFQVSDSAARACGRELLVQICAGCTIDEACGVARRMIGGPDGETGIEWCTPMVFLHQSCHQTQLLAASGVGEAEPAEDTVEEARWLVRRDRQTGKWENTFLSAKGALVHFPGDPELKALQREAEIELKLAPVCRDACAAFCDDGPAGALARLDGDEFPTGEPGLVKPLRDLANGEFEIDQLLKTAEVHECNHDWDWAIQSYHEVLSRRTNRRLAKEGLSRATKELRNLGGYVYDLFVSYAPEDFDIVSDLVSRLRADDIRIWFKSKADQSGGSVDETLDRCRHTLVCLSDAYCGSGYIREEVQANYRKDPLNQRARTIVAVIRDPLNRPAPPRLKVVPWVDLASAARSPAQYREVVEAILARRAGPGFPSPSEVSAMQNLDPERALRALRKHAPEVLWFVFEKEFDGPAPVDVAELVLALRGAKLHTRVKDLIESVRRYSEFKHEDSSQAAGPGLKALLELVTWATEEYHVEDAFAGPRDPFELLWHHQAQELGQESEVELPDSGWELTEGRRQLTPGGALYRGRNAKDKCAGDLLLMPVDRAYALEMAGEVRHCESLSVSPLPISHSYRFQAGDVGEWRFLVLERSDRCTLENLRDHFHPLPTGVAMAVARQIVEAFRCLGKGAPALTHGLFRYESITLDRTGAVRLVWDWERDEEGAPINCVRERFWFCRKGGPPAPLPEWDDWAGLRGKLCAALQGIAAPELVSKLEKASLDEVIALLAASTRLNAEDPNVVGTAVGCWFDRIALPAWMASPSDPEPVPKTKPEPEAAREPARPQRKPRPRPVPTPPVPVPSPQGLRLAYTFTSNCLGAWPLGGQRLVVWASDHVLTLVDRQGNAAWTDDKPVRVRCVANSKDGVAIGTWEGDLRWFSGDKLVGSASAQWTIGDIQSYGAHWLAGSWNGRLFELQNDGKLLPVFPAPAFGVHRIATSGTEEFAVLSMEGVVSKYAGNRRHTSSSRPIPGAQDVAFADRAVVTLTNEGLVTLAGDGAAGRPDRLPVRGALRLAAIPGRGKCLLVNEDGQSWIINRAGTYPRGPWLPPGGDSVMPVCEFQRFIAALKGGGYGYWRDEQQVRAWPEALAASISGDGCHLAVTLPDRIEAYDEDPA